MQPEISVIIPIRPGDKAPALEALRAVDYPPELVEIIVVEGDCPSRQRNQAAWQAKGQILYFLDDDSRVAPDVLRRLALRYSDPTVDAVGGPGLTPADEPLFSRSIGYVLGTRLGALKMRARHVPVGRYRSATEKELIGCNLSIRRRVLESIGGFREELITNEETKLLSRMFRLGHVAMYDPELVVWRSQRRSIAKLAAQFFHYGRGRVKKMRRELVAQDLPLLAPALGLIYLALLPLLASIWSPLIALPLALYLGLIVLTSLWLAIAHRSVAIGLIAPIVFGAIHASYGWGLTVEIVAWQIDSLSTNERLKNGISWRKPSASEVRSEG